LSTRSIVTGELVLPPRLVWEDVVRRGLAEDLGLAGDLTSEAIVPPAAEARARLVAREPGVVAGLGVAALAFELLDPRVEVSASVVDGARVDGGATLATVAGNARALLAAERVALNLLGRLSGIATATRALVEAAGGPPPAIVCTRKTTPGLRALEKYAVRAGGGANHRFGLDDAVLIKDNHVAIAGGVAEALARARGRVGHMVRVEVEVDDLDQLREALASGADAVLLDNMDEATLREAVELCRGRAITEASGGIRPETVAAVAATGVDLISVGWITHSAPALDVAMEVEE
jgi:nicotinate-nucleotide pyrophosphorylase (carboxylating)